MTFSPKGPMVSIVLPVYNTAPFLKECIQSIRNQSYTNWEIVLFNDGSTDNSLEVLESIGDTRMRIYSDTKSRGAGWCRNFLISKANGPLVALQDSDDFMTLDRLTLQVEFLESNPHLDIVGSYMTLISDEGEACGVQRVENTNFTLLKVLYKSEFPPHAALMARKSWFLRNPYPTDVPRGEDKFLIAQAIKKNDFSFGLIPQPLYFYRYSGSIQKHKKLAAYRTERSHLAHILEGAASQTTFRLFSLFKSALVKLTQFR